MSGLCIQFNSFVILFDESNKAANEVNKQLSDVSRLQWWNHTCICVFSVLCVCVSVCVCTFPDTFHSKQTNKAEIPWKKTKMNHEWIIKVSPWAFYWSHWRCCNIFQGFDNPAQFLLHNSRQWRHFKILWVSVFQTFLFLIHVCIKHYIWLDLTENRKLVSCVKTALWNMF